MFIEQLSYEEKKNYIKSIQDRVTKIVGNGKRNQQVINLLKELIEEWTAIKDGYPEYRGCYVNLLELKVQFRNF